MERKRDSIALPIGVLLVIVCSFLLYRELNIQSNACHALYAHIPEQYASQLVSVIEPNDVIRIILGVQALLLTLVVYVLSRASCGARGIWLTLLIVSALTAFLFIFGQT